jgi:hypothetical protein
VICHLSKFCSVSDDGRLDEGHVSQARVGRKDIGDCNVLLLVSRRFCVGISPSGALL